MRMRKRINKRIERDEDGLQVSASVNAVVSANIGEPGSVTAASSRQEAKSPSVDDEHARELPDREGTYDELREAAAEMQEANEGEQDE